jgi:hypothetical protein
MASQLAFAEIADDGIEFNLDRCRAMHAALSAIAASTLIEFDRALDWGWWCRRKAAAAILGKTE